MLEDAQVVRLTTAYGDAQATVGTYQGKRIAFMPRHGPGHHIPPHKINYRANILALKQLGVRQVLATAAVGSLQVQVKPGSLVIIDDFLDFTKSRPTTFFEQDHVVHVDVTDPYCHRMRDALAAAAKALSLNVQIGGTYVCTEGPRFETPAEIRLYQSMGAAVVGMTTVPEVVLAKEAELCYATVCMVTNYGAGISPTPLTHEEVVTEMANNVHRIRQLFFATIAALPADPGNCRCQSAVSGQAPLVGASREGTNTESH
ncbi:MAG: S-methyl-5'-thioadenosine phosphorylase [Alicyclobacillus sp.]|nr:S-methyl-5'-thioadenosine phosphorylase [Alicyclobacillus sp.]